MLTEDIPVHIDLSSNCVYYSLIWELGAYYNEVEERISAREKELMIDRDVNCIVDVDILRP